MYDYTEQNVKEIEYVISFVILNMPTRQCNHHDHVAFHNFFDKNVQYVDIFVILVNWDP